ncbi:MAG TPA: BrnT family toxin [Candidatus Acidoferrales bacterium]|nr:BrnT family toxin [Candidatus Acidoferrales bacterium]
MHFEWDGKKYRRNRLKHGVSYAAARLVFDDRRAISGPDRVVEGEQRWQTIGLAEGIVILVVAHTVREEDGEEIVRIISARKATPRERRVYESQAQETAE